MKIPWPVAPANRGRLSAVWVCMALLLMGSRCLAQTWTNGVGGNWSDADNWGGGSVPVSGTGTAIGFDVPGTYGSRQDLGDGFQLNRLEFGGPALTLFGNSFQCAGIAPAVNQNGGVDVTVSNNMVLAVDTTFGGSGNGALTLFGTVSGFGGLVKTHPGMLTLDKANGHSGGTMLNGGTLVIAHKDALGTGTLTLSNGTTFYTAFEVALGAVPNPVVLSGGYATVAVPFGGGKDIHFSNQVSGNGGIRLTSDFSGRWIFLSANNTFRGGVILDGAFNTHPSVRINNVNSLGTGTLRSEITGTSLGSGVLQATAHVTSGAGVTNAMDIAPGARLTVNTAGYNVRLSGPIGNSGRLVKMGAGTLTLTGSNTFGGTTSFHANSGSLVLGNTFALRNSTLDNTGGVVVFAGGITNFTFGGLVCTVSMGLTNASGQAVMLTVGGNGESTANSAALTGAGGLTKVGAGTLTLSAANTYSGPTILSNGGLRLTSIHALNEGTDVFLATGGGMLALDFAGTVVVNALYIDGELQPKGLYAAGNLPAFITGSGVLRSLVGRFRGLLIQVR